MTDLWHFTCEHGFAGLRRSGVLLPNLHPLAPKLRPVVWLTEDADPERDDVGLSSVTLSCDRMQYRYRVERAASCIPWADVRHLVPGSVVETLESFGAPGSWWVSRLPLRATLMQRDGTPTPEASPVSSPSGASSPPGETP